MKMKIGLLAAAAVVVLAGFARAEDSDKFLVRGEASKVLMEQNQINVVTAEAIGKACVEEAIKQGVRISIVILDQFGEPVFGFGNAHVHTSIIARYSGPEERQPGGLR